MRSDDDFESYKASNYKKDEFTKYHSSNFKKENEEESPGLLSRIANDVETHINHPIEQFGRHARNMAGGFGQGLMNVIPGLYNLGASGINALGGNVSKSPMFDFAPSEDPNTTAGEIASFFAGPGALRALGKIPELSHAANSAMKIPIIAHGIKHASNILGKSPATSRVAGNALLGGAYSPDNPLLGIGLGAGGGLLGEGISKGYSGIKNSLENNEFLKNSYSKINPTSHAKDIESHLSGGTNNLSDNSRQLVNDIRNAHDMRNEEAGIFFNYALDKAGNQKIYKESPFILNKADESKDTLDKIKQLNVGDLYEHFKSNPTFNNAHKLQSELGAMGRKLDSNPLKTQDDLNQISKINSAREQLNKDIASFLDRHDKTSNITIADKYKKGSELYKEHVAPFFEDKKLIDIVKDRKTDIKNIHSIFDTPSNTMSKEGIEKIGNINKILQDLPKTSKDRILFSAIGGNKTSPNALLDKLMTIKSKGYGNYFSPEMEESINALGKKIRNKELATTAGKIAGLGTVLSLGGNALSHIF